MTFAIFHDFPGLENGLPKFHDFPWPGGTLVHSGHFAQVISDINIDAPNSDSQVHVSRFTETFLVILGQKHQIIGFSRIHTFTFKICTCNSFATL